MNESAPVAAARRDHCTAERGDDFGAAAMGRADERSKLCIRHHHGRIAADRRRAGESVGASHHSSRRRIDKGEIELRVAIEAALLQLAVEALERRDIADNCAVLRRMRR